MDNFSKSPLFDAFHRKRVFHDGIWFDSNWEVKVYDFLKASGIQFEYSPKVALPYKYSGKTFYFHPDFKVGDRMVEIKGDQFFRINESTGQEEMFNPFRDPDWSDERYEWECGKFEAKHQCMLKHDVHILRGVDIVNLESTFDRLGQSSSR